MSAVDLPELPEGFAWRVDASTAWIEARAGAAKAVFTTRLGGASLPPFGSLNLGILTGDERGRVIENRLRIAGAIGIDARKVAIGRQVHGAELITHYGPPEPPRYAGEDGDPPEADGHVLTAPGIAALAFVADCLPIVMAGSGGAAVVHGGWRGMAAGIVERAAVAVKAREMVIGPGIGRCCYEVGEEVLSAFSGLEEASDGRMLDLAVVATALARRAGVEQIAVCGLCTRCNQELFFSHRREGPRTGRQAGFGWLESAGA